VSEVYRHNNINGDLQSDPGIIARLAESVAVAIKVHDLKYIRRSIGEIDVLRQLVSLQRCNIINPSEFWLAQMTNMSERSVRRALVKLARSGLISYDKHKQDYRGPNRPTNTYTLHPERIQELIDAGRKVVDKALEGYYETVGSPRHARKRPVNLTGQSNGQPVRLTGYTTGQIDPQDGSYLSIQ
jgi:predicted transcriptional regulator